MLQGQRHDFCCSTDCAGLLIAFELWEQRSTLNANLQNPSNFLLFKAGLRASDDSPVRRQLHRMSMFAQQALQCSQFTGVLLPWQECQRNERYHRGIGPSWHALDVYNVRLVANDQVLSILLQVQLLVSASVHKSGHSLHQVLPAVLRHLPGMLAQKMKLTKYDDTCSAGMYSKMANWQTGGPSSQSGAKRLQCKQPDASSAAGYLAC